MLGGGDEGSLGADQMLKPCRRLVWLSWVGGLRCFLVARQRRHRCRRTLRSFGPKNPTVPCSSTWSRWVDCMRYRARTKYTARFLRLGSFATVTRVFICIMRASLLLYVGDLGIDCKRHGRLGGNVSCVWHERYWDRHIGGCF